VIEVDTGDQHAADRNARWDKPITMEEFLAKQVILRAKRQSTVGLQAHEDLSTPSTLIVVIDNWPAIAQQGPQEKAKVTDMVEKTAKDVLQGYQFQGFRGIILEDSRGSALESWKL